ncbi:MAG: SufE family protein [Candidatus Kapabacteria bacterium]|nr:SufE family protein [Candidatus Kapabacteria bacterium]
MTMAQAANDLVEQFEFLPSWEDRYAHIISFGKTLAPYPEEHRSETYKVKGCQSQVWLHPSVQDGRIHFEADSDASIVKGIIAMLLFVYNDRTADEILGMKPDFIERIGLTQALSANRANGLASMLKQIQLYALALSRRTA